MVVGNEGEGRGREGRGGEGKGGEGRGGEGRGGERRGGREGNSKRKKVYTSQNNLHTNQYVNMRWVGYAADKALRLKSSKLCVSSTKALGAGH